MINRKMTFFILLLLMGCEVNVGTFDSGAAATHSLKYLEMIFLKREIKETYLDIHQLFKNELTEDQYINLFTNAANAINAQMIEAKKFEHIGGDIGEIHVYFLIRTQSEFRFMQIRLAEDNSSYKVFGIKTIDTLPKEAVYGGIFEDYEKEKYISSSEQTL